jgi:hypothetical protein
VAAERRGPAALDRVQDRVLLRCQGSFGETDTPKTGLREIPIAPVLARLLAPVAEGRREGYIALTQDGAPWGQYGAKPEPEKGSAISFAPFVAPKLHANSGAPVGLSLVGRF